MADKINLTLIDVPRVADVDSALNTIFIEVLGNKSDASSNAATASVVARLKYIVASSATAAVLGALNTAAHTGVVDDVTTIMGYIKQLITDAIDIKGAGWTNENLTTIDANIDTLITRIGNPGADVLTSITTKIGDIARSLDLILGSRWDAAGDLGTDIATILASLGITGTITGTSDSGTTGTLVDAALTQGADYFEGMVLVMTSGNNVGLARTIVDFDNATDTITVEPVFPGAIGTDTYTILPRSEFVDMLVGHNNNNNAADTSLVAANKDGSVLERLEHLLTNIGDYTAQANLQSLLAALGIPDVAGKSLYTCLITDRLDNAGFGLSKIITDIGTAQTELNKIGVLVNTGGTATLGAMLGDFNNVTLVAQLTAIKEYIDTEVAAIKAKTDTLGTFVNTAGVAELGAMLGDFSNITLIARLNSIDDFLDTEVASIISELAKVPKSDAAVTWNATALASIKTQVTSAVVTDNKLDKLIVAAEGAGAFPASVIDNSIIAFILSKVANGDTSSYDNTTDSLEAISDKISALNNISTANVNTEVDAALDTIVPVNPTAGSLNDVLSKAAGANTFNKTTDSLEMISDKMGGFAGTAGATYNESIYALLMKLSKYIVDGDGDFATGTELPSNKSLYDIVNDVDSDLNTIAIAKLTAGILQTAVVVTPDASTTAWTVAAHRLFTVTGLVEISKIFAFVNETVVEGAGADNTLSVGTSDTVDLMIGVTAGDALVTNDIWANIARSHTSKRAIVANNESFLIANTDIDLDVLGTNSIVDGTITFYCTWKPIGVGATVAGVAWD